MHDVEPLLAKQRLEPGREAPAHGNACDSSIRVNHEAGPNAPHVGMLQVLALVLHLGGHDGGGVTEAIQLPCEMVYVLRHAAELRIVVLRDERDAQRRHRARSASRSTADSQRGAGHYLQEERPAAVVSAVERLAERAR